jgi:hypothetical protein
MILFEDLHHPCCVLVVLSCQFMHTCRLYRLLLPTTFQPVRVEDNSSGALVTQPQHAGSPTKLCGVQRRVRPLACSFGSLLSP